MTDVQKHELIGTPQARKYSFITAVKTTGIFCKPTCSARKPKFENVQFVDSILQAIRLGYRACKRCKPLHIDKSKRELHILLDSIHNEPYTPLDQSVFDELNLNYKEVDNWFKSYYNIGLENYYQTTLINHAFLDLKRGNENLKYQSIFGNSDKKDGLIQINRITSVLGDLYIAAGNRGIVLCEFVDRIHLLQEFKELVAQYNYTFVHGKNEYLDQAKDELTAYFKGELKEFNVPTQLLGTPFQQAVWNQLKHAEYGTTQSYKSQAAALGDVKAIRAMATANGSNRIAIIIPCHRIVGSNGAMTGYAGGIDRKEWLINHERLYSGKTVQQTIIF